MANILLTVASSVGKYLAGPAIREIKYVLCANDVINDLENKKEALTEEKKSVVNRILEAKERTEVIEKPVEKWLNDVEKLLKEVEVLVQRTETDNNCFQGWFSFPTCGRYRLCKEMVVKIEEMGKFKGKSNDIQPFSHLAPLPGIQYQSSNDFIYFESRQVAFDQLLEALKDDRISIIGVYGEGGCGKTTLVTEVGKKAEELDMFDKVISFTVSQTPNIRGIQGEIADMLKLKLEEESERGRAQRLWMSLKEKKRILIIVDDLWSEFHLMDIGIRLDHVNGHEWKILVVTRNEHICTLMDCQEMIHLGHLSEDESWTLFRKLARIDDDFCVLLDGVPQKICNECKGILIAIKTMASSLRGKKNTEWKSTLAKLIDSKAFDDHEGGERNALNCIKLSYDCLQNREAELLFLMCCMFPEDYHIPVEDLTRYAIGLVRTYSFQLARSLVEACLNRLLESSLLMRGSVKMHSMVRNAALWIANGSDDCKILVNVDKPLSTVAEDNRIRDCFAVSSWWFNENPSFCQLHAPMLKMLLVNISAHSSLNSLDLSPLTFEGIQGLEVFSLTINYKIVPISFPQSIQLLTNVRTLRLNGLKLGNISFIASLTSLEILDLRRCYFNELPIEMKNLKSMKVLDLSGCQFFGKTYNRAIGKCSQLEELYASKCHPHKYVNEIIMDICILQNLQRFVLGDPIIPERTRVVQVNKFFNIKNLTTYSKNILQIAETISLTGLRGGIENIIPDMVGFVGGMNNLSTLHLIDYRGIECIFDTTCDFKEDDMIPRLVELRLKSVYPLTELYHGPPLQVLQYFEKLEVLDIDHCRKLHIIFPMQCNLKNLKILSLSYCKTDEVLFSESIAQSLQQLEQLTIHGCSELKHIIAVSGSEQGGRSTTQEIVPAPMNSHFFMTNIRDVNIYDCQRLESMFPLCYVEGVPRLQKMLISHAPKLEYVFGKCDHKQLSSHQNLNHVMLSHLEVLKLAYLDNLIGMCPENYQANWSSQSLRILTIENCRKMAIPWFNLKAGYHRRQHHLNEIWSFQCLQHLTLADCEELKCLLSMETHRSLPQLMYLSVSNCQELEQIVAANEELVELPNAELSFPKLKHIEVENCNKLKSLFPLSMVTMLPQLSTLRLSKATQLQEVFRHGQGDDIVDKMEIVLPNLTQITFTDLPNFEDICHGCKLHSIELLQFNISNCPKIAPGLTKIQDQTEEASEDSSSISNDVEDFIYFVSRQNAYDELFETLNDESIHMIGLYGEGGSGKTTLVREVAKKADEQKMFDMVISITVSRTPDIRAIQGQIADMLNLKLAEESEKGRAQQLWMCLREKKRILVIVDSLWKEFNLKDIGIFLGDFNKGAWKIIVITSDQHVFTLMNCQKEINLEILSQDESWILFQKHAQVDDQFSDSMDGVARKLCDECKGLPITIKTLASSLKGKQNTEWESALAKLRDSEALDDREERVTRPEAQLLQVCSLYPQEHDIPTEDLMRRALGLGIQSNRSFIQTLINKLFESSMQMRGSVKIHDMVRDTALWIADRSDNNKILVNVDKPLSIVAEDNNITDCFALSSWWSKENPTFCQLHAPNLKMLLVNISAHSSLNSLDLSPLTFEGIQGLEVFSLTINYEIVPISFPPSIQLLTNVRTLRLNGLKLGDISFIASLTNLEILDLRRCEFKELPIEIGNLRSLKLLDLSECHIFQYYYNGAIGKCSQLEELYASNCFPYKYVHEIILDIGILQNLQRFVLGDPIIPERTRVVQVNDFDISKLRTSNKNILQIAETISLKGLLGGSENIIPDMVGFVGGMNNLFTLHLTDCSEIECIFDTTYDFLEDELIPRFVELHLKYMNHLAELCHGPPLQVLPFFEKLELLDIYDCKDLHIIFPRQCNLQNLKILRLYYCKTDEVLFSESVAQSLQQLEKLTIIECNNLKHLIVSGGCKHSGSNTSEEIIPAPMNSHFLMTNLREVKISSCQSLESIFPIFYVEGLPRLQKMDISHAEKLKYVFGECEHERLSSYKYQNHVLLPHLEDLTLSQLPNLIGMCPEHCHAKWPPQCLWKLNIVNCGRLVTPWFSFKVDYDQRTHHLNENSPAKLKHLELSQLPNLYSISWVGPAPIQIWSFQCLQRLKVTKCYSLKCVFFMETHGSLPELVELCVYECEELEQIVAATAEWYFPKLKEIEVKKCKKLKSLFPLSMVTMLPQLSTLRLTKASQLQEVFRHSQSHNIMNTMEIVLPNLNVIRLYSLPNFVDICRGCKLHAVKLQKLDIYDCPNSALSLKQIQDEIKRSRINSKEDDSPLKHYERQPRGSN